MGENSMKTPKRNERCPENPFKNSIFDGLHLTPGMFKIQSTPSDQSPQTFRWSIEQQAFMNPIDIDDTKALEQSARLLTIVLSEIENPHVQRIAREYFESYEFASKLRSPITKQLDISPKYKLYTYVSARTFGEVPRLMFHHANVEFEDIRYTRDEFQNVKENFPNKQVPLLEVNGHPISQSGAIVRFLAYRFALGGKDEFERARADEIYGVFFDRMREHRDYHLFRLANPGQDNKELFESSFVPSAQKALPFYEQVVDEANEHGGFVLKSGICYADFVIAEHVTTLFKLGPQFEDDHPNLTAFAKKIYAVSPGVERYVAQRPDTIV
ncbi:CRE-GST-13 protein [Aphelenchoides besseyi]|nr:CRE-GST-13 protein [Aphelenchoides besseyi]